MRTLLVWLLLGASALAQEISEVKIWYYPTAGPPALIKHWSGGQLKVDRRYSYSRLGRFRIRVQLKNPKQAQFLSIQFQDQNATTFDLPAADRKVEAGVKDVYWMVPYNFVTGPAEVRVSAYKDNPLKGNPAPTHRTDPMSLGTVTAR